MEEKEDATIGGDDKIDENKEEELKVEGSSIEV